MKLSTTLKKISLTLLVVAAATACSVKGGGNADSAAAIKAAEAAMAKAKANKWIWRDTGKLLKKAKAADKKGDSATAVKLANKAKKQAELAVAQYEYENNSNRWKYMQ